MGASMDASICNQLIDTRIYSSIRMLTDVSINVPIDSPIENVLMSVLMRL